MVVCHGEVTVFIALFHIICHEALMLYMWNFMYSIFNTSYRIKASLNYFQVNFWCETKNLIKNKFFKEKVPVKFKCNRFREGTQNKGMDRLFHSIETQIVEIAHCFSQFVKINVCDINMF